MTTWTASNLEAKARHGFKNSIAGLPSLCGRARFPAHGAFKSTRLPYCRWCTDKARPPDAPNTGGMHAKGAPWALEGRWIRPKRENPEYYIPNQLQRSRKVGEDLKRRRGAEG